MLRSLRIALPSAWLIALSLIGPAHAQPLPNGYAAVFHEGDDGLPDSVTLTFEGEDIYHYQGMMVSLDAARDRTGDGQPEIVIADMTSRSTTTYLVLTLAEGDVEVLAVFDNVFFNEDLVFEDRDGDGLKEPTIQGGDALIDIAPIGR